MAGDKLDYPIIYLESSDFDDTGKLINDVLLSTEKPVIVMIQSKQCGWCNQAKVPYTSSAEKNRHIIHSVIDVEKNPDTAKKVSEISRNYRGLPHYMCYKNGELVSDDIKGRDEDSLVKFAS